MGAEGLEKAAFADLPTIRDEAPSTEPVRVDVSSREQVDARPSDLANHAALLALAAKARLLEKVVSGDERILVAELRAGLEALCGPVASVTSLAGRKAR